ncbi:phage antirepressor [Micropruina sp.]|uniref:phage antirepressor n=1 Tax=Micropruina sp. TaxID=2737536 RepID=UPI0039E26AB0
MSADLVPFVYGEHPVRTLSIDGEPWFVLADLARVLGIASTARLASRLDEGVRLTHTLETAGGRQQMTIVSEAGMYEVVIRSDKAEAVAFRRWITSEVLPAIRKHGGYLTPELTEQVLTDPDTIIRLATDLKAERARRAELEAKAKADAPKVLFADAVATSKTTILVGELAKILRGNGVEIGQQRLFADLRRDGYLIRREGTDWNMPTQRAMELGLFRIKETAITHSDGHVTVSKTPKVTGKGQRYFVERYLRSEVA